MWLAGFLELPPFWLEKKKTDADAGLWKGIKAKRVLREGTAGKANGTRAIAAAVAGQAWHEQCDR
jgi:hypothetical protein